MSVNNVWNNLLPKCWSFVSLFEKSVIVINNLGIIQVYLIGNFRVKSRDFSQNELTDAQDITTLIDGLSINVTENNKSMILSKINNIPKMDFSFGHDNWFLVSSYVRLILRKSLHEQTA